MAGQTYSCRVALFSCLFLLVLLAEISITAYGALSTDTMTKIIDINQKGPYLGIIAPNTFEMNPLLESPSFQAHHQFPYLDVLGNVYYVIVKT